MIFDNKRIHMCNDFFNRSMFVEARMADSKELTCNNPIGALQVFLLSCCQKEDGGFTDKPNGCVRPASLYSFATSNLVRSLKKSSRLIPHLLLHQRILAIDFSLFAL